MLDPQLDTAPDNSPVVGSVEPMLLTAALTLSCATLQSPEVPSARDLRGAWRGYAHRYVKRGRVIDPAGGSITTSEGQAYAMLRAVWSGDRLRFERVRRWTRNHLQEGLDAQLPAWKWGSDSERRPHVLDPQPATDADQLIAYSLLLASTRWQEEHYHDQALGLLDRIWDEEVTQLGDRWVLLPGPWAHHHDPRIVNPSYFLPFAWRVFAREDPSHPWDALLDDSYTLLTETLLPTGLPPDWAWLDPATGKPVTAPEGEDHRRVFGFESFRVFWNLAADFTWYGEPRALPLLDAIGVLADPWRAEGWTPAIIGPEGSAMADYGYVGLYGAILPAWAILWPEEAPSFYAEALASQRRQGIWADPDDYYTQNWVWFGLALWTGLACPPERLP